MGFVGDTLFTFSEFVFLPVSLSLFNFHRFLFLLFTRTFSLRLSLLFVCLFNSHILVFSISVALYFSCLYLFT